MVTDISNLNHWAEKLGLDQASDEIYRKTKINLISKIYDLASDSRLSSVFENEVKALLKNSYPGLSEFLLHTKEAKECKDIVGVKVAKDAFGDAHITKVKEFLGFANRVHRHFCENNDEACTYCNEHQLPNLEYYEGQSLQEELDNECLCENFDGNSCPAELEPLKVCKSKSLKNKEQKGKNVIIK